MLDYKKVQKILLIILEGLVYLSFLMPFVYINKSIFPFIVGKILYFQIVVQIMAVFYILLLIINFREFCPKKTLLSYWFVFYAITLLLSAIFGVDFNRAFWSNFERMTGAFVIFHFIVYSIIVSVVLNDWPKIKRALQVLLAASLIQVAVIAAQYSKPGVFLYPNKGGRVWGTLGNSIYVGSYFLFHIFFALFLAVKEKKQLLQIIYLFVAFLEIYIIVHSKSSKGADLALLGSILFIFLAYAFFSKSKALKIDVISILAASLLFLGGTFLFKESAFVQKLPLVGDIVHISLAKGTGRTRAIAWDIATKAFKERPVFGWGLENFYYAFNKYYNPESLRYSYYETWFDRSHSIIFDTLSTGGIVGTVSYFGLFAVGAYSLVVALRRGLTDKHALIFLFAIFSTYLMQNLFVFDHPASYFLIYFSFGIILSLVAPKSEPLKPKYHLTSSGFFTISFIILVGFLVLLFSTSIKTYKAATGIIRAESIFVKNYRTGLAEYKKVLAMRTPFIDDMRLTMAKRIGMVNATQLQPNWDYKEVVLFAREEMLKQLESREIDVYDYMVLGQLDTLLTGLDNKYFDSAEQFFAKAKALSPRRQQINYVWGKTKLLKGDNEGAEKLIKEALAAEISAPDSYWYLSLVYKQMNKKDLAWENIMKSVDRNYAWKSPAEINFAVGLGEGLKKYQDMPRLYILAINQWPTADLYVGLARTYERIGEKDKAMEALTKARAMDPNAKL